MMQTSATLEAATRHSFRAMGTDISIVILAERSPHVVGALRDAEREVARLAATFTRFIDTSELQRLNRSSVMRCSPEMIDVLQLALAARERSHGMFDPFVLPAMLAAGYDRTFTAVSSEPRPAQPSGRVRGDVDVDRPSRIVRRVHGELDLGGIAKGWIADRIASQLARCAPALVDAGGDIACTPRDDDQLWEIVVDGAELQLGIAFGGIATSGIDRRTWTDPRTGIAQSHVIDPSTGTPIAGDLTRVTCVAATCADAEVAATALLVGGRSRMERLAREFGVPYIATTSSGGIVWGGGEQHDGQ